MPNAIAIHTIHLPAERNAGQVAVRPGEQFSATQAQIDELVKSGAAKPVKETGTADVKTTRSEKTTAAKPASKKSTAKAAEKTEEPAAKTDDDDTDLGV